jgi:hypothetical protein
MQQKNSAKLIEFVEASKLKGASDEFLASVLAHHGWPEEEVFAALGGYWERVTGIAVPERTGRGESSRDAFLYLLSFSTLAIWTSALGSMLFRFIEHWYPDPVVLPHADNLRSAVTWQMASIAVAFPIFLLVMRTILVEARNQPERLQSGVRKWLTYIALLLTAGGVISDLICFLDYFLTGELTARFLLKALTVLLICAAIFLYYVGSLKWGKETDLAPAKNQSLKFGAGAAVAVVVTFCVGLGLTGAPSAQRRVEADNRRTEDLEAIAYSLRSWSARPEAATSLELLPATLTELQGKGINSSQMSDPETKAPYEYRPLSATKYELCATFSEPSEEERTPRRVFWYHGKGRTCFTLDAARKW